jgi:F-type H+-transporting ATPase subunit delta
VAKRAVARRYAQAAFELALESGELDRWKADLERILQAISEPEVRAFLESPGVPFVEREKLLAGELKGCQPLVLNLLFLLIARQRLDMLGEIVEEYGRMLNSHRGIQAVEVTTAIPLNENEKDKLAGKLGRLVGKKVVLENRVDREVVGGFKARIGDRLLDGSAAGRLESLKRALAGTSG